MSGLNPPDQIGPPNSRQGCWRNCRLGFNLLQQVRAGKVRSFYRVNGSEVTDGQERGMGVCRPYSRFPLQFTFRL